jgi:hypothetical protein
MKPKPSRRAARRQGVGDQMLDRAQRVGGCQAGAGVEQVLPETPARQAAEVAGNGVGLAEAGREKAPGIDGGRHVEDGVEAQAQIGQLAAGGTRGLDEGEDLAEGVVGKRGPGLGGCGGEGWCGA